MRDYANRSEILNQPRQRYSEGDGVGRLPKKRGWLIVGIIGLAVVVIVAVVMGSRHHQKKTTVQAKTAAKQQPVKPKAPPKPQGPIFDFYKVLPAQKTAQAMPAKQSVEQAGTKAAPAKAFILQVASYQAEAQAQQLMSQLKEQGLLPALTKTQSGWYRIDLGPFDSVRAADKVRHSLQNMGINGAMVRQQ